MGLWWQAFLRTIVADALYWAYIGGVLCFCSVIGATLGSWRRWYWARWQCGLLIGIWISCDAADMGETLNGYRFLIFHQYIYLAASALGGVAALAAALLCGRWFDRTESIWAKSFRDHPFGWLRARSVRFLIVLVLLVVPPLHFAARWRAVDAAEQAIRNEPELQAMQTRWASFRSSVYGTPEGLKLFVRSRAGLSPGALELIRHSPWPVRELIVPRDGDICDADLIAAAPSLIGIRQITLIGCQLTDAGLPAFAACPDLRYLHVFRCASITSAGLVTLSSQRPALQIGHQTNGPKVVRINSGTIAP